MLGLFRDNREEHGNYSCKVGYMWFKKGIYYLGIIFPYSLLTCGKVAVVSLLLEAGAADLSTGYGRWLHTIAQKSSQDMKLPTGA